ncbi:MAG: hypothetical protein JW874_11580 [Spirochaetales bacterium]|nr:hypothetical protein [Spirochaetales bacterium]
MRRTGLLTVNTGHGISRGRFIIHPNDGYELGLMNREYSVGLYINEKIDVFSAGANPATAGSICLENSCRHGVIEMSAKQWAEMGQPEKVVLIYENGNLLLLGKDFQ